MWFRDEEAEPRTEALTKALRGIGVRAGTRVASLVGNTPAAIALHRIMLDLGIVLVPLDPARPDALTRAAQAQAVLLVAVEAVASDLPVVLVDAWGAPLSVPPICLQRPNATETGVMLWSSGTTGNPRTVLVTPTMLEAHATACKDRLQDGPHARWLAVLGLHHVGGVVLVDRSLRHGSTLWLEPRFDAVRACVLIEEKRITHVSLVPTQLRRVLATWGKRWVPRRLHCVLVGGDALPPDLVADALEAGWPMHATYGLTEATSQVATAAPDELRERPGTSGRVLPGVVATIDDGEIVVSGPTVAGGRCATGDVGRIDANGFLFVEGRRDDRITTGGAKVDPARVEAAIRALDGVSDAAVVGVPDHEWGQRVVAAVVADTSEAALRAACRTVLAAHEVPRQFLFVEALPRTDNGKLQRAKLRSALQATTPT